MDANEMIPKFDRGYWSIQKPLSTPKLRRSWWKFIWKAHMTHTLSWTWNPKAGRWILIHSSCYSEMILSGYLT
jgi:hypothetical protein